MPFPRVTSSSKNTWMHKVLQRQFTWTGLYGKDSKQIYVSLLPQVDFLGRTARRLLQKSKCTAVNYRRAHSDKSEVINSAQTSSFVPGLLRHFVYTSVNYDEANRGPLAHWGGGLTNTPTLSLFTIYHHTASVRPRPASEGPVVHGKAEGDESN